jgi:hypothetical protein
MLSKSETNDTHRHYLLRCEKFFTIGNLLQPSGDLYISVAILVDRFGINLKTILGGISLFKTAQSPSWEAYGDAEAILIRFSTIPVKQLNLKGIPRDVVEVYNLLQGEKRFREDQFKDQELLGLFTKLKSVYHKRYQPYIKYYVEKFKMLPQRITYAKSHALVQEVIYLRENGWPDGEIFQAYRQLAIEELGREIDKRKEIEVVLQITNQKSFFRKINDARKYGIAKTLIHGAKGVPRLHQVILTDPIKAYIRTLLRKRENHYIRYIRKAVKRKFGIVISESSVKKIMADKKTRNLTKFYSQGAQYSRNNSLPNLTLDMAKSPGQIYEADYWDVQFPVQDGDGNLLLVTAFIVLDVFSSKVVGWQVGYEDFDLVAIQAYQQCFRECCFMCEETVIDNDPDFRTDRFKKFRQRVERLNVIVTNTEPGLATAKPHIEAFFAKFQKMVCADFAFYKGEGKTSRNRSGNPSRELIQKYYQQKRKLPTFEKFREQFAEMIHQYNYHLYDI